MKKYLITISSFLLPFVVLAQEMQHGAEDSGMGLNEFKELLPFVHITEGHWPLVIVSILLWASLIYTAYSLINKSRKPQQQ